MRREPLEAALEEGGYDIIFGRAPRDEEKPKATVRRHGSFRSNSKLKRLLAEPELDKGVCRSDVAYGDRSIGPDAYPGWCGRRTVGR